VVLGLRCAARRPSDDLHCTALHCERVREQCIAWGAGEERRGEESRKEGGREGDGQGQGQTRHMKHLLPAASPPTTQLSARHEGLRSSYQTAPTGAAAPPRRFNVDGPAAGCGAGRSKLHPAPSALKVSSLSSCQCRCSCSCCKGRQGQARAGKGGQDRKSVV